MSQWYLTTLRSALKMFNKKNKTARLYGQYSVTVWQFYFRLEQPDAINSRLNCTFRLYNHQNQKRSRNLWLALLFFVLWPNVQMAD